MLDNYILPALGKMPLEGVERSHVVELHRTLSDRPASANRAVRILSHMYRLGEGWGLVPEGCNPCRSVEKYIERSCDDDGFSTCHRKWSVKVAHAIPLNNVVLPLPRPTASAADWTPGRKAPRTKRACQGSTLNACPARRPCETVKSER